MQTPKLKASLFHFPIVSRSRSQLGTPLDGRYGAMSPSELRESIATLIPRVNLTDVDYVVGIPEGGLIPAYEFASSCNLKLVLASHSQPASAEAIKFYEPHSIPDRSAKYIYGLRRDSRVIIVEDEVTTGRTVRNCVGALRNAGIHCNDVVSIYCADDAVMRSQMVADDIRLHYLWTFGQEIIDGLTQKTP
jgi:adenine/guanine phosphoribosyltransferase-like PRPP-binding protein